MMTYMIATVSAICDQVVFDTYRKEVPETIKLFGKRFIVRGSNLSVLEGEWPTRMAVIALSDGTRYDVTAPDDASEDDVLSFFHANAGRVDKPGSMGIPMDPTSATSRQRQPGAKNRT